MKTRTAPRLAWGSFMVAMILVGFTLAFLYLGRSTPPPQGAFGFRGFSAIFAVVFGTVGVLIATRQPNNPIGWIGLALAVTSGLQEMANQYAIWAVMQHEPDLPLGAFAAWFPAWIWIPATSGAGLMLLLFPDGHLLSPRWRWVVLLGAIGVTIGAAGFAFAPGPLENFRVVQNPFGVASRSVFLPLAIGGEALYGLAMILSAVSVALRFRRSRGVERLQMKWLVASGSLLVGTLIFSFVGQWVSPAPGAQVYPALALLVIVAFLSLPVAMAFAILKYRLYDIDVVIRKTVVFAIAAVILTVAFVVGAAVVGTIVSGNDTTARIAVAFAIGVLFEPARRLATRIADKAVFGGRATPYEVLTEFSRRAAGAYETDDVLPRLAQVAAAGVGATGAHVWVRVGDELLPAATTGEAGPLAAVSVSGNELPPLPDHHAEPVFHRGELLGAIAVSMPGNDPMTPEKARLIADLAAQAGAIIANVRLLQELRESRRRIMHAQDEERRKIERNIHDGVQQHLVALAVKARLADTLVGSAEDKQHQALIDLQEGLQVALDELRDLARGIYPPLLADKGLAVALEAQARRAVARTSVVADGVGRYPKEIEAAVYFSCLEAMQNVAKYADASNVQIELTDGNGELAFRVIDDGKGFDTTQTSNGTGLQGIADRLAALDGSLDVTSSPGGGTSVVGRVPLGGMPA
jgi:signal transduction histidine kinase